jgi:hypothetical protein
MLDYPLFQQRHGGAPILQVSGNSQQDYSRHQLT